MKGATCRRGGSKNGEPEASSSSTYLSRDTFYHHHQQDRVDCLEIKRDRSRCRGRAVIRSSEERRRKGTRCHSIREI